MTSDAKHVEIGLTDKSDSARWILADLWRRGIAPSQVLIAGDEFGPLGGLTGSDSYLLVPEAIRATVVSVGVEPTGVPSGIVAAPGGPATFFTLLADQRDRRRRGDVSDVDERPGMGDRRRRLRHPAGARARVAAHAGRRPARNSRSPADGQRRHHCRRPLRRGVRRRGIDCGAGKESALGKASIRRRPPPAASDPRPPHRPSSRERRHRVASVLLTRPPRDGRAAGDG